MAKILIADDHEVVRRGVRVIVESRPGWRVVAEAADGRAALAAAVAEKPDVAILDFKMPILDGLEVTRRLRQLCPKTQVLIFTMLDSEEAIGQALRSGARGYVMKSDAAGKLAEAIQSLIDRRPYFSWRVSEALLETYLGASAGEPQAGNLTAREREVVRLIAEGRSNREAGELLKRSVKTIETHRASAMRKIGASSTADLVRYAVRHHMIEP